MAKKTEQEEYAELMEMKTNKAAKQFVHVITSSGLNPTASICHCDCCQCCVLGYMFDYIIDEMRKLLLFFLLIILCQFDAQAENGHKKEKPKSHLEYEGNYVVLDWPRTSKFGWAHKHKDGEVYVYVRNGNCYKPFSQDCGHYDILVISVNGKIVQVHKIAMGEKLNKAAKEYLSRTDKHSSY